MKSKIYLCSLLIVILMMDSCKKSHTTPDANVGDFYYGNIKTANFVGPGNAILLREDGTMREYANDYYSAGTSMTANDTATALIKLDGSYTTVFSGSVPTITAIWLQPNGSPALTYTLIGTISGNTMTGTIKDEGTGISTIVDFSFIKP